jgi:hypothetical protein
MATRVRLELDPETFGRLVESAVAEQRPADWQAEVLLRRVLGTWDEPRIGLEPPATGLSANTTIDKREGERAA